MVSETAQLYTIEGIGAAILMVVTAYLVISSTTIFTPQDVHITDMQLQQLGNDALAMMDVSDELGEKSILQRSIEENNPSMFNQNFSRLINATTSSKIDTFNFNAVVFYRSASSADIKKTDFCENTAYLRQNAVTATRWVYIEPDLLLYPDLPYDDRSQVVLLEVLLWRN